MTTSPAYVVRAVVSHERTRPFSYRFRHRTTQWLVDVDAPEAHLPRWVRPLARIRAEDHLGSRGDDLRAKLTVLLAEQGLAWTAHRVQVLVGARTFGYAFNPLTTYFCFAADGNLEGILAEVHNTYGERHVYPLEAGPQGSARVDKGFYVSPFFAVEGRYDIKARLDESRVSVSITLTQGEERVFTGTTTGRLVPAGHRAVVRAVLRDPFAAQRVTALIRFHGIRLWLRRLPVIPRRPHQAPRGMA